MKTPFTNTQWRFVKQLYPTPKYILISENSLENEVDLNIEANRTLIESAPAMYNALQTIMAYAEVHGEMPVILKTALLAIQKANPGAS